MLIGYARVSTAEQDNSIQIDALRKAGCELIFEEKISGGRWERPKLKELINHLRKDDIVVVWKLDRLSRSLKDLLFLIEQIEGKKSEFRSLTESIDTTKSSGRMMMQMVGVFAEFEREMLKERTKKGLEHARKEGRIGGRKSKLKEVQKKEIKQLIESGRKTAPEVAKLFDVHPATIYRLIKAE